MNLWMSGELESDVADVHREARKIVQSELNERFEQANYGGGLKEWAFISMILGPNSPPYKEVKRYNRNEQSCEFRLRIDHDAFAAADRSERAGLLCQALLKCLDYLASMKVNNLDIDQIRRDCLEVARLNGWNFPEREMKL